MRMIDPKQHASLIALANETLTTGLPAAEQPGRSSYNHWRWHTDVSGIAWVLFDKENASTNTLSAEVLAEFDSLLTEVEAFRPRAMVIRSMKANGFAAGADISEFRSMIEIAEVTATIRQGLEVFDRLSKFPAPTIAVLHGLCLGGGLELALACRIRIGRDDLKIGFPEVMLGLHPGLAGTWRTLDVATDPVAAMTFMLTGRTLDARRAKRLNLIDVVVPERHAAAAVSWAAEGKLTLERTKSLRSRAMTTAPARAIISSKMENETRKRVRREHYPAPYALIDLWREHGGSPVEMRLAETESFARLITGQTAQNLTRVFFLREALKANGKGLEHGIVHVHVIGAGVMGGDIAAWCAKQGFRVTLQDRNVKLIGPAIQRAAKLFEGQHRGSDIKDRLDRLMPDPNGFGLARADLIIEAVPERLDIKHAVYAEVQAKMKPGAILASNTSSILLEDLRAGMQTPSHFLGLHFFNPVAKMPLVEIVTHDLLDPLVQAKVQAFTVAIDKLPLPVKSAPGFLVNRTLTPYMMEAFLAYGEGIKPELIDAAAEAFGMPMGPIELADTVGLDVALHVARELQTQLPGQSSEIPEWFIKLVEDGKLGRKTGQGIYTWTEGKAQKAKLETKPDAHLQDRLILPMINATVACLRERVIDNEDAADAGVIFGTGFAPFRGGPLHYARSRGLDRIFYTLEELTEQYGPRFAPDPGWQDLHR
ncbi:3-hydroxyacyl-CoA dehydrogenase/enoyl-CoA hydratase/3-hydroxybutyryl-CoA epimerase [Rhodoligotrophos appendicifer]|uniref:3-hydroxyacyl-CoA dehydrogenase NAD-binding domain-containing protein n=1 Tax=Rhodoligotrophos appendicifer TaxID=987056 RepID=UPI0011870A1D|nr:3-hydroxyacyl-CoA dehydrogenase NAD-binding domain-containing protein [Rhodoligotrophos appendicifer]